MQRNVKALCVDAFDGKTFEFGAIFSRQLIFFCFSEKDAKFKNLYFSMGRSVRFTTHLKFASAKLS